MRKRLVIGAIAAVVIGVGAYLLSQPRKGTVEWHKREYRYASRQPLRFQAKNFWYYIRGKPNRWYSDALISEDDRKMHARALAKLGYLADREFVVSNRPINAVLSDVGKLAVKDPRWWSEKERFFHMETRGSNVIAVVARFEQMAVISNSIRQADMTETK